MAVAKFAHELSIATGADGFRIYGTGSVHPMRYARLPDVDYESPVVNLDEGLVHIFGRNYVYEVRADREVDFVVQTIERRFE